MKRIAALAMVMVFIAGAATAEAATLSKGLQFTFRGLGLNDLFLALQDLGERKKEVRIALVAFDCRSQGRLCPRQKRWVS